MIAVGAFAAAFVEYPLFSSGIVIIELEPFMQEAQYSPMALHQGASKLKYLSRQHALVLALLYVHTKS